MKQIGKIKINKDSDFWKQMQRAAELDVEKAAAAAAEHARKETQARIDKKAAQHKAFLDSLRYVDKLEFRNERLREQIRESVKDRAKLQEQISAKWVIEDAIRHELEVKCLHDMVLERETSWKDEYDQWCKGNNERKCLECFLVEQGNYRNEYDRLNKSTVVLLRQTIDNKEFELEFDDLKW
jgi:hypothetical protein